jgi:nitroreductase
MGADNRGLFSNTAVGFIGQNVYLYYASEGLATVVRGAIDRKALTELLGLRPVQRAVLAQSVGYPGGQVQYRQDDLNAAKVVVQQLGVGGYYTP